MVQMLRPKTVKVAVDVDQITIVTYHGSQSTDYAIQFWEDGKKVKEIEVASMEAGIKFLQTVL